MYVLYIHCMFGPELGLYLTVVSSSSCLWASGYWFHIFHWLRVELGRSPPQQCHRRTEKTHNIAGNFPCLHHSLILLERRYKERCDGTVQQDCPAQWPGWSSSNAAASSTRLWCQRESSLLPFDTTSLYLSPLSSTICSIKSENTFKKVHCTDNSSLLIITIVILSVIYLSIFWQGTLSATLSSEYKYLIMFNWYIYIEFS